MNQPLSRDTSTDPQSIDIAMAEQAMQWQLDLQEPQVSAATLAAWQRWREAHPLHETAWQRAETLAQRLQQVRSQGHSELARATLAPNLGRRRALKQLGLLLAAGAGAWAARDTALIQDWSADYSTRVGQQRRITLADQTQLQLNTDTAITLAFDRQQRRIRLLRGELLLTLARQDSLPALQVETVEGWVQARAAIFSVRQLAGRTELAVYQGELTLLPRDGGQPPLRLGAGEQAGFSRQGLLLRQAQGATQPAWSQGMLVAQAQPLAQFLEELGRYRPGHLGCDPSLAQLKVSGTFPLADTDRVLSAVAQTLHLEVRQFTRYWVTLKPRTALG
ncbi:FecR domain-containing protein [Pseudomonas piscis]|uniref:FecR domain-containing protein n=1 Tax=Pseudomonas piscis TaxID=2614538 RepID=UPI0003B2E873|nr:FecR domain-containing protein [Pseudomonas piscis]ERO60779.1 siderophore-interacting protein [Pseudomonas piscis]